MFVGILNTSLTRIGWKSYLLKKNVKIINFPLETSRKRNVIVFRGIFRTQSNIYNKAFEKIVNGYMLLTIFGKKLHSRFSTGF